MKTAFVCVMLAIAATLPGCEAPKDSSSPASSAQPATATTNASACDLLSEADAAHALSHPVQKLDASGGAAGLDICQYGYEGERIADTGNVSVTLHPQPLSAMRAGVEQASYRAEAVPGLNDAFWSPDSGLYVAKGNRTALIFLGAGGMTDAKARAVALGRTIQAKM